MSVYDKLEKWKDGTIRYAERYEKGTKINGVSVGGRYKKATYTNTKGHYFYNGEKVGIWNKEPQQKIVPEINHSEYVKGDYYRASISLNIPINGTKSHPNYKNFTYVKIDKLENINMQDMYEEFIQKIESNEGIHYKRTDFWFDFSFTDCDIQNPKPYSAKTASETFGC